MRQSQMANFAIPLLPCVSIDEQLSFYRAAGFDVTFRQTKPNAYACVSYAGVELHFFTLKSLNPSESYCMCYIRVADVDAVYRDIADSLKRAYGKLPTKGIPRITKPNTLTSDRRFNIVDPGGNWLMIGQKLDATSERREREAAAEPDSKLARAYGMAYSLAYAKNDFAAAAKVLDAALARDESVAPALRYKALVLRADTAAALNEQPHAERLLDEAARIPLSDEDREAVEEARQRAGELEQSRQPGSDNEG